MYWRVPSTGKYWQEHKGAPNRRDFKALVENGRAKGVLAFDGSVPIGWCSIGLRSEFAYFDRARKLPPSPDPWTWSVTCFFVARASRNRGVAGALLQTAVDYARAQGLLYRRLPIKAEISKSAACRCIRAYGPALAVRNRRL